MGWPIIDFDSPLTDHQLFQLEKATVKNIGILGGSPGCGKTFAAAELVKAVIKKHGKDAITVIGPTGKSAVRISEVMQSLGVTVKARTIHSLLGVEQVNGNDGWKFKHSESNPLHYRFIVVDESSMIDTDLMAALLAARAKGCCVLFIGDVNQLAPVGHGAPLRDMITAGLPYGELREIKRQGETAGIVQACADMRDGKRFAVGGNLKHFTTHYQVDNTMSGLLFQLREKLDCDPVWDCQVLVPCKKGSPLRTGEINKALQPHLNQNPAVDGSPFRMADKVINTRNRFYPPAEPEQAAGDANDDWQIEADDTGDDIATNDKGDIGVANGEIGCVTRIEPKYFEVLLFNPRREVRVPRGAATTNDGDDDSTSEDDKTGTGCDWDLAYALTVHKSQGSEWKHVIVLIDEYPGAKRLCDRSWIYTAISRAKETCSLIGRLETAQSMARVNNIDKRKTFLRESILEQITQLQNERRQCLPVATDCEIPTVMEGI